MSYDNLFWGGLDKAGVDVPNHSQWRIKAENLLSAVNIFTPTTDKRFPLGAIAETRDGRRFRYCKNGGTALVKNVMVQTPAQDAQQIDTAQTAYGASAGVKKFDVLMTTANGISAGDLIDGYLIVNQGTSATDEGDMYIINSVKWTTSDTVLNVEIADAGGLRNAIAATSNITVIKNIYRDVIVKPTTMTGPIAGCNQTIVAASSYFWAQTRGPASCIIDTGDTVLIGDPVGHIDSSGTAGSCGLVSTFATDPVFGHVIHAAAGADYGIVNLNIE